MVTRSVERAELAKHAELPRVPPHHGHPHARSGADIRYIQQMLGHAEQSTTQIYTQVSIPAL